MHAAIWEQKLNTLRVLMDFYLSMNDVKEKVQIYYLVRESLSRGDRDDIASYIFDVADHNRDKFIFPFNLTDILRFCCRREAIRTAKLIFKLVAKKKVVDSEGNTLVISFSSDKGRYELIKESILCGSNGVLKLLLEEYSDKLTEHAITVLLTNAFIKYNSEAVAIMLSCGIIAGLNLESSRLDSIIYSIKKYYNLRSLVQLQKILIQSNKPNLLLTKANSGDEELSAMLCDLIKQDLQPKLELLLMLSNSKDNLASILPREIIFNIAAFTNEFNPSEDEVIAFIKKWSEAVSDDMPSGHIAPGLI